MMLRHTRDEDALADAIRANRRSTRDSQRATGTEKALTTQVAQQASVDSVFAKELAEQLQVELGPLPGQIQDALDAADAAQTTANGKSTVVRSTSAATGAGSFKLGDQWWQFSGANIVGLWLHSGSAWVEQVLTNAIIATLDAGKITTGTLSADRIGALSISSVKIAAGAIIAEKIAAGAITTAKLAADAIDGMTITGALIRTAATGLRFEMDALGLRAFNASNAVTASLAPESGGLLLSGSLTSYPGGNTPRAVLSNGSLVFDLPGSGGASNLAVSPGNIRSSDSSTRLFIAKDSGSAGTGLTLQAGASPGNTAQIHVNGDVTGGLIELAAGTVRKSTDYTWAKAGTTGGPTLKTGWTNRTSLFDGLALQSKLDEVFLNGTIEKNSNYAALDVIATLPVGCRPTRLIAVNASYAGTLEYVLVYPNGNVAASRGGTSATWINIFGSFPTT